MKILVRAEPFLVETSSCELMIHNNYENMNTCYIMMFFHAGVRIDEKIIFISDSLLKKENDFYLNWRNLIL